MNPCGLRADSKGQEVFFCVFQIRPKGNQLTKGFFLIYAVAHQSLHQYHSVSAGISSNSLQPSTESSLIENVGRISELDTKLKSETEVDFTWQYPTTSLWVWICVGRNGKWLRGTPGSDCNSVEVSVLASRTNNRTVLKKRNSRMCTIRYVLMVRHA